MYRSRIVLTIRIMRGEDENNLVGWTTSCPTNELTVLVLGFRFYSPERRRVAEAGQGILTNMFEHVDAQRIVRVYEEA